jgi:arginyl-tRNA synthetase
MTSFEGDTGPYLQYAHVRLTWLTQKNPELLPLPPPEQIAAETLAERPSARDIPFLLGTYPDVARMALRTREPSGVVTFPFRLAHAISSAWETVVVKGETDVERGLARMWLYFCDAVAEHSAVGADVRWGVKMGGVGYPCTNVVARGVGHLE